MGLKNYFFDTYAFFEIVEGNKKYDKYKKNVSIITTKFNLMEFHFGILRKSEELAEKYYDELSKFTIEATDEEIKHASIFKFEFNKTNKSKLSYIDSLGYTIARKRNIKFLTGDKEFKGLEGVEFVK